MARFRAYPVATGGVCQVCDGACSSQSDEYVWLQVDYAQKLYLGVDADLPANGLYFVTAGNRFGTGLSGFLSYVVQGGNVRVYSFGGSLRGYFLCDQYEILGCNGWCNGVG